MNLEKLDALIEPMRQAARIPGLAIAIVAGGATVFARGYGYRDLQAKLAMTEETIYPIASTTKAMNATLLGMLVDEGRLAWDMPVQSYLPRFRLGDSLTSAQVTVRDLVTMRTGLPRHDWLWKENLIGRADLVKRIAHLELSAGFRERFQYNNLTVTTAGHIAEVVTGQSWEELVRRRLFEPLRMSSTEPTLPISDNVSLSYHENARRELFLTKRLASEVSAPSGGAIHSTVVDMARWMLFNLNGGKVGEHRLIEPKTLAEIHSPQVVVGIDPSLPTSDAVYAMGWFVDTYGGHARLSHGGYLHDVNSEVMLFPKEGIGIVSFSNFGPPRLARLMSEHVFDLLVGIKSAQRLEEMLALYEKEIGDIHRRNASVCRVQDTSPSHGLDDYAGSYVHAGYGQISIRRDDQVLILRRYNLELPLEHWHYDAWVFAENDLFPIHKPHPFDRASRIVFEANADGEIIAFSLQLEPAVAPAWFMK